MKYSSLVRCCIRQDMWRNCDYANSFLQFKTGEKKMCQVLTTYKLKSGFWLNKCFFFPKWSDYMMQQTQCLCLCVFVTDRWIVNEWNQNWCFCSCFVGSVCSAVSLQFTGHGCLLVVSLASFSNIFSSISLIHFCRPFFPSWGDKHADILLDSNSEAVWNQMRPSKL